MSVTIRLSKVGRKNAPAFKIVAVPTRKKRYTKFLDVLGYYNPSNTPAIYELNEDKYKEWVGKGALVSEAVQKLREGTYKFKPYNPNAKEEEKTAETTATDASVKTENEEKTAEATE
jgi:small subunit ribosomal protein S16